MKNLYGKESGITLMSLVVTVVIMIIVASISISLLKGPERAREELLEHENVIEEFYDTENQIKTEISDELNSDYNTIQENTNVDSDEKLPVSTSIDDWDGHVNKPHLLSNMTAIYFNEAGNEVSLTNSSSQAEWNKWYDYSNQKWANAKTSDGSYWVWIPRFAYKITNQINNGASRNISIVFIDNKNRNNAVEYSMKYPEVIAGEMTDYVVHPAFGTNLENGGTNTHRSGFWVAKYEMSMEKSDNGGQSWYYAAGVDALTKNAGNSNSVRAVSKPGVSSWRNITIGNAYSNAFHYNREEGDSHLMKNSEWGAVAYLTHSVYGRDGVEVARNTSSTYITGSGGVLASSTGNEYGVYDLNGGAWEFIPAYILSTQGENYRNEYASSFAKITKSTEYVTIYPHNKTSDGQNTNWKEYYDNYKNTRFGDAILETSTAGSGNTAWNNNVSLYARTDYPFMIRSGDFEGDNAAIFGYSIIRGNANESYTFRTVMF